MSVTNNRHVAVLAFPFATHAGLLLGLVRRLAAAAPDVTFSFFSTSKSNRPLFSLPNSGNIRAYDVSDGLPPVSGGFQGNHHEEVDFFLKAAPESFRSAVKAAEAKIGKPVSCLMADAFLWFSGEMAEEMDVVWVPLWTSGACSLSVHFYTDLIRQTVGICDVAGRENEILEFVPGYSTLRLGDLPSGVVFGDLKSPFAIMVHKMGQALPRATVVPINSFEELDPLLTQDLKSKFRNFLNVGPFNLTSPPSSVTDEHGCLPWLDNKRVASVAYIGFGTVATPPPNELVALAEALEASGTPFLWSLRDNFKAHFPKGFINRTCEYGKIVPWAPQVQILAHKSVGVFITHCGWNSVLESIAAGVPMIGRPFFGDHQINTYMVENVWQIGVRVEGGVFTKSATMSALELVMDHEKGKKLKEQIGVYKELSLKAVGPNGSSTENFKTLLEVVTK